MSCKFSVEVVDLKLRYCVSWLFLGWIFWVDIDVVLEFDMLVFVDLVGRFCWDVILIGKLNGFIIIF